MHAGLIRFSPAVLWDLLAVRPLAFFACGSRAHQAAVVIYWWLP